MLIFNLVKKVHDLLPKKERFRLYRLLLSVALMSIIELFGVVSIFPFMSVAADPNQIYTNKHLSLIFNQGGFSSENSFLIFLGSAAFLSIVLGNFFRAYSTYSLMSYAHMQNHLLSKKILENYLSKDYEFYLNFNSADLVKNVLTEVSQFISGGLIPILRSFGRICSTICLILILVLINPFLAIVVFSVLASAYIIVYKITRKKIATAGELRSVSNRTRIKIINETSGAIKEIKLMNKENVFLQEFEKPSKDFASAQTHNAIISEMPRYFLEAIGMGGILLIVFYMVLTEDRGQAIAIASMYAVAGYKLLPCLQEIFSSFSKLRFSSGVINEISGALGDKEPILYEKHREIISFKKTIHLKDVIFQYPKSNKITISNLNLSIEKNSITGIIGQTGSGKTTLVDIILGLLSPTKGCLLVDDVQISKSNLSAWQKHIGYVPQNIYLADASVESNIAFGVSEKDIIHEKVVAAAKMAQIDDFITDELEYGYKTVVGERGVRLSGGQRQRLGIARALYLSPQLLVLDEATSALDTETEDAVAQSIDNLSGTITIIIIAHRLSTLRKADKIIKLENGTIVEEK